MSNRTIHSALHGVTLQATQIMRRPSNDTTRHGEEQVLDATRLALVTEATGSRKLIADANGSAIEIGMISDGRARWTIIVIIQKPNADISTAGMRTVAMTEAGGIVHRMKSHHGLAAM